MVSKNSQHIIIGISGGVDSAVAALLLKEQGYRLTAVFMKNWEEDDSNEYCAAEEDLAEARKVCAIVDIPLRTINFSHEYWDRVFTYFLKEYAAGRTPNPDVVCNKEIKFKAFLDYATDLGADRIATGHYARIDNIDGQYRLLRGCDADKDQTYFLHTLDQYALSHSLFPLGELKKSTVRQLARKAGLPNYNRKDSTGICFIGERRFNDFLSRYLPGQVGEIHTLEGKSIGTHHGIMYATVGQRHGLGIGGPGGPWYVVDKDIDNNILYVVQGQDNRALYRSELVASHLHWIQDRPKTDEIECTAKIRYRQQDSDCRVFIENSMARVNFLTPQRAIAPGQSVVFYQGDICLGGGIIQQEQHRHSKASKRPTYGDMI